MRFRTLIFLLYTSFITSLFAAFHLHFHFCFVCFVPFSFQKTHHEILFNNTRLLLRNFLIPQICSFLIIERKHMHMISIKNVFVSISIISLCNDHDYQSTVCFCCLSALMIYIVPNFILFRNLLELRNDSFKKAWKGFLQIRTCFYL